MKFIHRKNALIISMIILSGILYVLMSPRILNKIEKVTIGNQIINIDQHASLVSIQGEVYFEEGQRLVRMDQFSGKTQPLIGSWTLFGVPQFSVASYGFFIETPNAETIALKFTPWIDATIILNSEKVFEVNENTISTFKPGQPIVVNLSLQEGFNEIIFQVANTERALSGITSEVILGSSIQVFSYAQQEVIFDIVFFTSFLMTGLFFIIQALLINRNSKIRLLYTLVAMTLIVFAFNITGYKEKIIFFIFPNLNSNEIFRLSDLFRASHFVLAMSTLLLIKGKIFHVISRWLLMLYVVGYWIIVLILPMHIVQSISMTYFSMMFVIIGPITYKLLKSTRNNQNAQTQYFDEESMVSMLMLSAFYGAGLLLHSMGFSEILQISYYLLLLKVFMLISFFVNNQLNALQLSEESLQKLNQVSEMKTSFFEVTSRQLQQPISNLIQVSEHLLQEERIKRDKVSLNYIYQLSQKMKALVQSMIEHEQVKEELALIPLSTISLDSFLVYLLNNLEPIFKKHDVSTHLSIHTQSLNCYADSVRLFHMFEYLFNYLVKQQLHHVDFSIQEDHELILMISCTSDQRLIGTKIKEILSSQSGLSHDEYALKLSLQKLEYMEIDFEVIESTTNSCSLQFKFKKAIETLEINEQDDSTASTLYIMLLSPFGEVRMNLEPVLTAAGYRLTHISDMDELIECEERVDVIMIDLDYWDEAQYTIEYLKEHLKWYEIPIYGLSLQRTLQQQKFIELGLVDILRHPFSVNEFNQRIKVYQQIRQMMETLVRQDIRFLQSQIKPHFLFNALSIIIGLCTTDGQQAASLLENLSDYLRSGLELNQHDRLVPLEREINMIQAFVNIEKARFQERVSFKTNIDVESLSFPIVPFLIQPLVENAIKHGICVRESGGEVELTIRQIDDHLLVQVSDDGVGMTESQLQNISNPSKSSGIGLSNVMQRLDKIYKSTLHIESHNSGSVFSFKIERRETL